MFSDGVPSIAAASTGLLAGYLYETDGFGLQSWRLPRFIEVSSSAVGMPFTSSHTALKLFMYVRLQRIFEAIAGFVGALVPTPAPFGARPGARAGPTGGNANMNNGTRHNLMMGDSPRGTGGGGGFFNDLQQFQGANPHGDFQQQAAPARRTPVPVPPPSEDDITTLMVGRVLVCTDNVGTLDGPLCWTWSCPWQFDAQLLTHYQSSSGFKPH